MADASSTLPDRVRWLIVTPERRLDGRRDKTRISRRHTLWTRTSDKIGRAVRAGADTSGPKIGGEA